MSHSKASAQLSCGALEGEPADRPVPRRRRDGVEDRVLAEQRVVREVHLGDQPLGEGPAEQAEVDVRRPPGVVVVAPRVGAGLDRHELVAAQAVGDHAAQPVEVRVQRRRATCRRRAGSGRRRWPARPRPARRAPGGRRCRAPARRRGSAGPRASPPLRRVRSASAGRDPVLAEHRAGDLGEPVRQVDRRAQRRAQRRCSCSRGSRRGCAARRRPRAGTAAGAARSAMWSRSCRDGTAAGYAAQARNFHWTERRRVMAGRSATPGRSVTSRALAILDAFDAGRPRLSLSEIAERSGHAADHGAPAARRAGRVGRAGPAARRPLRDRPQALGPRPARAGAARAAAGRRPVPAWTCTPPSATPCTSPSARG